MARAKCPAPAPEEWSGGARTILEQAKLLFARKGFGAVSIQQIAQGAGVSKANVFHHFGSKDDLYLAVLKAACEETMGSLNEALGGQDAGMALWRFFSSQLEDMLRHQASARLILREIMEGGDARERSLAEQVFDEYFNRLVNLVKQGQGVGLLRTEFDPALLAYLMLGANTFFFENHRIAVHLEEGAFARSAAGYSQAVFQLLLQGALADPSGQRVLTRLGN